MSDHVGVDEGATTPQINAAPKVVNGTSVADVFHCNSVDVNTATNQMLVSARHTNAVYNIDRSSGLITWKLGGTASNKDGARILTRLNDPVGNTAGQHDARYRSNGDITFYDNHSGLTGPSRGVEYAINVAAGTATWVWQYAAPDGQPATATGTFRRSADGNDNVIGWGFKPGPFFTEVNASGNVLLEATFPNGEFTYRTKKVAQSEIDVDLLRHGVSAPTFTGWESLGGISTSAPAVASRGSGKLDVFVRGGDNAIHTRSFDRTWSGWSTLGGTFTSAPAVAARGAQRLELFARGEGNQLFQRSFNKTWGPWKNLGGGITSAPAVVVRGAKIDVFARGNDGQLMQKTFDKTWSPWKGLGGVLVGAPAATSWSSNRIDVFVRGTTNQLHHKWFDGNTWSGWESLGGVITAAPAATTWKARHLEVFVQATDGTARRKTFDKTAWSCIPAARRASERRHGGGCVGRESRRPLLP